MSDFQPIITAKTLARLVVLLMLAAAAPAWAQALHPGTTPTPNTSADWWMTRHQDKIREAHQLGSRAKIVLIGDSITQDYEHPSTAPQYDFLSIWQRYYGKRGALNLGFMSDNTGNVLWRLQNGEIDGLDPKAVILLIGTNNTAQGQTIEQTTDGIEAIVALLRQKLPKTHIIVLGILPSDLWPAKSAADRAVNLYLVARYQGVPSVTFLDIGAVFLKNGALDTDLFMDPRNTPPGKALHPDAVGQARMAAAIEPVLAPIAGPLP